MQELVDDIKRLREMDVPVVGELSLNVTGDYYSPAVLKALTDRFKAFPEAVKTINRLVDLVGELEYHLITAQTVAVNVAAELVRLDDMPSSEPEDYDRKLPRWILRQIADANDFQVGRANRLKKGVVDEIAECKRKSSQIAALARGSHE